MDGNEITRKTAESLVNFWVQVWDRVAQYRDGDRIIIECFKENRHRGSTCYQEATVEGDKVVVENWED